MPYYSTLSHKRQDFFWGGAEWKFEYKMFIFMFSRNLSKTSLILRRIEREILS